MNLRAILKSAEAVKDRLLATGLVVLGCVTLCTYGLAQSSQPQSPATALTATAEAEIDRLMAEIDRIEAETLATLSQDLPGPTQRTVLLGKLLLFDKQLSVNRNEACAFCHMPETGFTGAISELNATTVAYPGSVRTRF